MNPVDGTEPNNPIEIDPQSLPAGELVNDQSTGALSCNPSLQELYDYVDGRLDEPQKTVLQSHFQMCTGCDDAYHFHLGLRSMIGTGCREEVPPEVRQRLLDSITKLF